MNRGTDTEDTGKKPLSRLTRYGLVTLVIGIVLTIASLIVPALYNGTYGLYCLFVGILLAHVALVLLIVGYQLSVQDREEWDAEEEL